MEYIQIIYLLLYVVDSQSDIYIYIYIFTCKFCLIKDMHMQFDHFVEL